MNEGKADRILRVLVGVILGVVAWMMLGLADGAIFGVIAGIVALVLILTGIVGFCPAYRLLGIRTCPVSPKKSTPDQAAS